jgi:hypothetical protein
LEVKPLFQNVIVWKQSLGSRSADLGTGKWRTGDASLHSG